MTKELKLEGHVLMNRMEKGPGSTTDSSTPGLLQVMLLAALLAMGGCRSAPSFGHSLPSTSPDVVVLRPGLMFNLSLLVAGKTEISESAKRVSDGGTVVLPLLGEIHVADMTLDDLTATLSEHYAHYYVNPQVILDFVRDTYREGISPWGFVTVLGRVKEPGRVPIPATRDMTVSGAIQQAGGFATSAKINAILVSRPMPDGKIETRTINLHAVGAAGRLEEDIILEASDVVFVPEAFF